MATFIIEVLVGSENFTLTLKERGEGVCSIDTNPMRPLVGADHARKIGVDILMNLNMGEVELEGEKIGWLAWSSEYVEGSALSDATRDIIESLQMGVS